MKILRASLPVAMFAAILAVSFGFLQAQPAGANTPATPGKAPVLVTRLNGNLDTKSAKAGDTVSAKVVQELKLPDLDVPKGSRIVGTIVSVQSKQAGNGTSALAIKFDHVELKSGAVLRIQGLIVAIGQTSNSDGLGANSVLSRGGAGSTPGIDASMEIGHPRNQDDIPPGSSLDGVALGLHLNADGATELRGVHTEIKIDSSVMLKVALFKSA